MRLEQLFEILIPETVALVAVRAGGLSAVSRNRPRPGAERETPRPTPAQELVDLVGWDEV